MIFGIGIDMTEIGRIHAAQAKNAHFAEKVLTAGELEIFKSYQGKRQDEFLAGRFSVKEAYSKAYGTGLGTVQLHDVETLMDDLGKPVITKQPFAGRALVSISHTADYVVTQVLLERSEQE
ncbi:4-phosphopantetheinyl transferase [Lactobacillus selangorensis]|uniref:Holo-[acyl-carrier-protein] synthase n=1 Tax=Lactobacillus selangorensis TaxID=81857 RepID=A0A0R2FYQ2_9LACO|nr:holo-ACP synthase [Lactobacillus selangorensis]KRN27882.1 4-phosphopantetheinyl transferase [Lactobacillus selangorensis]KRN30647.1 4-phosphopantetheinyl transferase [Lactobacillus selangorensis]